MGGRDDWERLYQPQIEGSTPRSYAILDVHVLNICKVDRGILAFGENLHVQLYVYRKEWYLLSHGFEERSVSEPKPTKCDI